MRRPNDLLAQLQMRIAADRRAQAAAPRIARQQEIARALDGLNAWDALEAVRRRAFPAGMCFGPGLYMGGSAARVWVGVLIWRRAPGYYGYKTLTLYGVWGDSALAINGEDVPIAVRVGTRAIPYTSDFYTAEAWFRLMRDRFDDYYADDGHPPEDTPPLLTIDQAERLMQRGLLSAALAALTRDQAS
jgi:hypothetical protein